MAQFSHHSATRAPQLVVVVVFVIIISITQHITINQQPILRQQHHHLSITTTTTPSTANHLHQHEWMDLRARPHARTPTQHFFFCFVCWHRAQIARQIVCSRDDVHDARMCARVRVVCNLCTPARPRGAHTHNEPLSVAISLQVQQPRRSICCAHGT